jgi:hypothetical protein
MTPSLSPRVLVASLREIQPTISRCFEYENEDVIARIDDVDLIAEGTRPRSIPSLFHPGLRLAHRLLGTVVTRIGAPVPHRVERDYDLFYFHVESSLSLSHLRAFRGWREHSRIAVCRIEELWLESLRFRGELRILEEFDHVFVGCRASAEKLQEMIGTPVTYSPPAVDTLRFCPWPEAPERCFEVYSMGRRAPSTHQELYRHAIERRGSFLYDYDTRKGNSTVHDVTEHRERLASRIRRSRFFLVNHAKADRNDHTGGQQEVGFRFFEGAAGGAVMIGCAPDCDPFREHFDWEGAVISLPYDSPGIVELIGELSADPGRIERIRYQNVVQSLRRHDVAHRWRHLLETVGMEPRPQLAERIGRLESLAEEVPLPGEPAEDLEPLPTHRRAE